MKVLAAADKRDSSIIRLWQGLLEGWQHCRTARQVHSTKVVKLYRLVHELARDLQRLRRQRGRENAHLQNTSTQRRLLPSTLHLTTFRYTIALDVSALFTMSHKQSTYSAFCTGKPHLEL